MTSQSPHPDQPPDQPPEPVLIVGTRKIAAALGLSVTMTKRHILGKPGFPAWRLRARGQWITTRAHLTAWAKTRPEAWAQQRNNTRKRR